MDLTSVVGNTALICTILSNFAGLPLCLDFFKTKSTANVSILPFVSSVTCVSLWFLYSVIVENSMLQTVNGVSVSLQTFYIICFYINTSQKALTIRSAFFAYFFIFAIYLYTFYMVDVSFGTTVLGYAAAIFSVVACASPMANIKSVVKAQSTESMPFLIIFSTFLVTSLWYFYGVLVEDKFIQVPNLIGTILGMIQLSLFVIYPSRKAAWNQKPLSKKE